MAFVHSLEASEHDNVLYVLEQLLRELFTKAQKEDRKTSQCTLKDLGRAVSTPAKACRMLLAPSLSDGELRERVYAAIGRDELTQALSDIGSLARQSSDMFYTELAAKQATVTRFFPTLLRVIQFDASPTARPQVQALQWLHQRPDHDPATTIVDKAWQRHVLEDDGKVNARAFSFCAIDKLRVAIRRRDVFVNWGSAPKPAEFVQFR